MDNKKLEKYKKKLLEDRMDLLAELQRVTNGEKNKDRVESMDPADLADASYTVDPTVSVRSAVKISLKVAWRSDPKPSIALSARKTLRKEVRSSEPYSHDRRSGSCYRIFLFRFL
jgi:hypothetical protein